jgi:DNA polymerase III epsilon subunit-like protein
VTVHHITNEMVLDKPAFRDSDTWSKLQDLVNSDGYVMVSQSIATAIGQTLIYTNKFPISLVLIGVLRSAQWGRCQFRTRPNYIKTYFIRNLK